MAATKTYFKDFITMWLALHCPSLSQVLATFLTSDIHSEALLLLGGLSALGITFAQIASAWEGGQLLHINSNRGYSLLRS